MARIRPRYAQRPFTVVRDAAGVPEIRGDHWLDAVYGLGYMHAVDRGTQLLFGRSVASGKGAEQISGRDDLLETDKFFRRIGLNLGLEADVAALDQSTLDQVLVYCAGVNDGLKAKGRSLPMWAVGYEAASWDVAGVVLMGRLLSFGGLAVSQLENEILLVQLIQAGAHEQALREMFAPRLDGVDFELVRQVKIVNRLSDEALETLVDLPRLAGSNAWAVSPNRSATGHALLAGDPHLEVNRLPAIWYEAVLRWPDGYVMGASLPGMPLFTVARSASLAWAVTYIKADTIDLFIEDCRSIAGGGWQYRRGDHWLDFEVRTEPIYRRNGAVEELRVLENSVGTLNADPCDDGKYLSVAWAGRRLRSSQSFGIWLDLMRTDRTADAMDLVVDCEQPTLCFVFADRDGHIGRQGCGKIPERQCRHAGLAPLPAWDVNNHWLGWLPTELLPSEYDPVSGFVATANEECNPLDGPLLVTQTVHDYRLRRIQQQLNSRERISLEDCQRLQYDVVSVQASDLLILILPALEDGWLKDQLAGWNRGYEPDSQTAPIFQQLYRHLMQELLGNDQGIGWRRMLYLCSRAGYSSMIMTAADRLWQQADSHWWQGRDKQEMIRNAAKRVVPQPDIRWADVNYFHFADRFLGHHRVGRLLGYTTRQHAMPGCHATPFQGHVFLTARRESTFSPSYHFVTDLGSDEAWTNLPGGPSESRFSRYYRSDIPLWLDGEYKRLAIG